MYNFFLDVFYKDLFGSALPKKPKPHQIQFLLMVMFFGWQYIREKIMRKFQLCKDIEFLCILHVLDEVIPLAYLQYPAIFRSGNIDDYIATMSRFAILFIIWERRHYNKCTLSSLSDLLYHRTNFPQYFTIKRSWYNIITEKKVELWHSVLRYFTQKSDNGKEISKKAWLAATLSTNNTFNNEFVRPYSRGYSGKDFMVMAGKAAESLLKIMVDIGKNLGTSKMVSTIFSLFSPPF